MTTTRTEGYLVLALDDARYLDLAANVAVSVRRVGSRPISVAINSGSGWNEAYRPLFDQVVSLDGAAGLRGAMNKLALFDVSPYHRTLYLDADCLVFSPKIELFWRAYRDQPFVVEGHCQREGAAFACSLGEKDAGALCRLLDIPYLGVFNAGVIYFERTAEARAVFACAQALYSGSHRDAISYRYKHAGEYADEPFFAAALGKLGITPRDPPLLQRLQVTTPNLVEAVMDIDVGDLRVIKQPAGAEARVWSGVVCHFCGLAPMDQYFALADKLRREIGLAPMDRTVFNPVLLTAHHRENNPTPEPMAS